MDGVNEHPQEGGVGYGQDPPQSPGKHLYYREGGGDIRLF